MKIPLHKIHDDTFVSLPSAIPDVRLPLHFVGITDRAHYVRVKDPFGKKSIILLAEVKMMSSLKASLKGVHMSRMEVAMSKLKANISLEKLSHTLCVDIAKSQNEKNAYVEVNAVYEKSIDKNPSNKKSHEILTISARSEMINGKVVTCMSLKVPVINACPCPQRWALRDFDAELVKMKLDEKLRMKILEAAPLQSHTNLGYVTLDLFSTELSYFQMYEVINKSCVIASELLSGADEHVYVKKILEKAQFCEDLVREIFAEISKKKLSPKTKIRVAADINECVHHHNLHASASFTMKELLNNLTK